MARRREKGSGTVYESPKGSGKWWAKLPDPGTGSPRKWRVEDKEAGKKLLREKLRDQEDGYNISQRPATIAQQMDHYLTDVLRVRVTTGSDYAGVVRRDITPHLGKIPLDQLSTPQIRRWVNTLAARLARNTVRNALVLLRAALQVAVDDQIIRRNPTDGVKLPKEEDGADGMGVGLALTHEEAAQFLVTIADHRLYALYFVALATGMRQAELIGLRWSNVVRTGDAPEIRVREQIRPVNGKPTVLPPKSKKSRRNIPIDPELVAILERHWREQQDERQRIGDKWHDELLVFPSEVGTPLSCTNLIRNFKAALRRTWPLPEREVVITERHRRLLRMRFHDLRHTAGSLMLADGAQMTDVSEILGHSSVAITARIYAHGYTDEKRKAVSSITKKLRRKK